MRAGARRRAGMVLSCRETGRPSHGATDPRTFGARDDMAGHLSPLEYSMIGAAPSWPNRRLVFWFEPEPPIAAHQKVVTYLALRDAGARIFSAPQRALLLSIGNAATPSRRQLWGLRQLSRMAARLDMGGGLDS